MRKPDAEIDTSLEVYEAAKRDSQDKIEKLETEKAQSTLVGRTIGILQKIKLDDAYNNLFKYAVLYQFKESGAYLATGMNWDEWCESEGLKRRTVDENLADLKPLYEVFSAESAGILGLKNYNFSKLRYLGKSVSAKSAGILDGKLMIEGKLIPFNEQHRDEIEAAIDALKESHRREVQEKESTIKAKDRILNEKEKVVGNLEHDIKKLKEELQELKFSPGEQEFLKQLGKLRSLISGSLIALDPETVFENIPDPSPRMHAAYLELITYLHRYIYAWDNAAKINFGHPDIDGGWSPGQSPKVVEIEGSRACKQCKAAHPACDKCCSICLNKCNAEQNCHHSKE